MNLTMQLTLDGLVKALKAKGHEVAERVEEGREAARENDRVDAMRSRPVPGRRA